MANIQRLKLNEIQNEKVINADDINAELDQLVLQSNTHDQTLQTITTQPIILSGVKTFSQGVKTDTVQPVTAGATVSINNLNIATTTDPVSPVPGQVWLNTATSTPKVRLASGNRLVHVTHPGYIGGGAPRYVNTTSILLPYGLTAMDDGGDLLLSITDVNGLSLNTSSTGPAGIDVGTVQENKWYYVWLCRGSSGTTAVLSTSVTAPVLPTGYTTHKRRLPLALKTSDSGALYNFRVLNWPYNPLMLYGNVFFDLGASPSGNTLVLTHGSSQTFATVSVSTFIPPIAEVAILQVAQRSNAVWLRRSGTTGPGMRFNGVSGYDISQQVTMVVGTEGTLDYKVDANSTHIAVIGYYIKVD
jgi:hypothetical protein